MGKRSVAVAVALGGLVVSMFWACRSPEPSEHLSEPIIHIGSNAEDSRLMETAILVVIRAPFETVRRHVADPSNLESYLAFVTSSTAEPLASAAEGVMRVSLKMSVADVLGVSISGMPMGLDWRQVQSTDSVFAVSFERVEGAYEHMSGNIYLADLSDGSTAAMLRITSRSGFVPEAVRGPLARWHAEESLKKLAALLEESSPS